MSDTYELEFSGQMRGALAKRFAKEAEKRKISPAELAADIIEAVAEHDLFTAVLED